MTEFLDFTYNDPVLSFGLCSVSDIWDPSLRPLLKCRCTMQTRVKTEKEFQSVLRGLLGMLWEQLDFRQTGNVQVR